ncbi:MAG: carboxyltransferase domain-containing protein, partial [Sulfitobacter sp. SK025]
MKTRYTYGGDEHIYVEVDDEMSLDAFFKSLSMSNAVRNADIKGVTEICPANASFQVRYDPDIIAPEEMMKKVQELEDKAEDADKRLKTRIIEIPVYYQDP